MAEEKLPNRIIFPVLGILMNLCMGNLYAWSVFRIPLQKQFGWTAAEATVPFQLSIVFFGVAMVLRRWQDKVGPRTVAMVGESGGCGFVLSSFFGPLMGLYITFGVGGTYRLPTLSHRDHREVVARQAGTMTGLVVSGSASGAIWRHRRTDDASVGVLPTFLTGTPSAPSSPFAAWRSKPAAGIQAGRVGPRRPPRGRAVT